MIGILRITALVGAAALLASPTFAMAQTEPLQTLKLACNGTKAWPLYQDARTKPPPQPVNVDVVVNFDNETVSWEGNTARITKINDANVMFDILLGQNVIISGIIDRVTGSTDIEIATSHDTNELQSYDLMCKTVGSVAQTSSQIVSLWCNGTEQFTSTFSDGTASPFDSNPIKNTGIAINTGNKTVSVGGYGWTIPFTGSADLVASVRGTVVDNVPDLFSSNGSNYDKIISGMINTYDKNAEITATHHEKSNGQTSITDYKLTCNKVNRQF